MNYSSHIAFKQSFAYQFSFRNGCADGLASLAVVNLSQERSVASLRCVAIRHTTTTFAWFLEITFVCECMPVCVYAPRP